jgi:hypothetical protein
MCLFSSYVEEKEREREREGGRHNCKSIKALWENLLKKIKSQFDKKERRIVKRINI